MPNKTKAASKYETAMAQREAGRDKAKLSRGDILVLDNLSAHHDSRGKPLCRTHGVRVIYLPPYSHDFNPIELAWGLQKQHVRRHAPRHPMALRRVARLARYRVTPRHCRAWFAHCGYRV
jgi:transposase